MTNHEHVLELIEHSRKYAMTSLEIEAIYNTYEAKKRLKHYEDMCIELDRGNSHE